MAAEWIGLFDEVLLELDHQGIDVGDVSLDGEKARRQLLAIAAVFHKHERCFLDDRAAFSLPANQHNGHALFSGQARDEALELLILLL